LRTFNSRTKKKKNSVESHHRARAMSKQEFGEDEIGRKCLKTWRYCTKSQCIILAVQTDVHTNYCYLIIMMNISEREDYVCSNIIAVRKNTKQNIYLKH
jgi:hypothetical protein